MFFRRHGGGAALGGDSSLMAKNTKKFSRSFNSPRRSPRRREPAAKADNVLYIGIDLGTSQSSIVCSSGVRQTVQSVVGWPKDLVSEKLIKKPIVFGDEALRHRLAVDIYYPLERGVIKKGTSRDEEAAMQLIKHLIELARPQPEEKVYVVIGAPAEASVVDQQSLVDGAKEFVDAVMVVSEPFTVAYGLSALDNALVIDIGAGTVDLCRMHGTFPQDGDQKTLYKAGSYVDQKFYELLVEKQPDGKITTLTAKRCKEQHGLVSSTKGVVQMTFPVAGVPFANDVTEELVRACESIVPEILEAVTDLIADHDPEFQEELRHQVILAGGGSQIRGLDKLVEAYLEELGGGKVKKVEDYMYAGAAGALLLAREADPSYWHFVK